MSHSHTGPQFIYILACADNTYYVGIAKDVPARLALHQSGKGCAYTRLRRPVVLVHKEGPHMPTYAVARECQIKNWSQTKKEQIIKRSKTRCENIRKELRLYGAEQLDPDFDVPGARTQHQLQELLSFLRMDTEADYAEMQWWMSRAPQS